MTDSIVRPTISLEVAQHVLWHFGDTNLGIEPGSFRARLMVAASAADLENFARLQIGFPELMAAFDAVKREPWGLDWLRGIVKADLDGRDRGLDFAQLAAVATWKCPCGAEGVLLEGADDADRVGFEEAREDHFAYCEVGA